MMEKDNQVAWKTKKVLLHKDKQMRKAKADDDWQPFQLDLFQTVVTNNYSNSVELYQTLPDVFSGKQDKLRNADGTLPVLSRHGVYHKTSYTLDITPANITVIDPETSTKKKRAFYKTVVADFIECALHKLSISDGFFLNDGEDSSNEYGLITTYYQIREELIRMGKNYSYEQIKEGILILAGLRYELSWDISKRYGVDSFLSPIDLTIKNDKTNPHHSELYITFNRLISKKILALDWRWFNYEEFMKVKRSFSRVLFMRLSHRFIQANPTQSYQFLLSTLIEEWALQAWRITNNIRCINKALQECSYIIESYTAEEIFAVNQKTNRRVLSDYKVIVYPTEKFQLEQYRLNVHHKNIKEHRITDKGDVIIKPMRDQYPASSDYKKYLQEKKKYDSAHPNN